MKQFIALLLLLGFSAHAGIETGNGGIGFEVENELYLLDLVEARVHREPFFMPNSNISKEVASEIENYLTVSEPVSKLVAKKLKDIYGKSPQFDYLLRKTLYSLDWRYIPHSLLPLNDHNDDVLDLSKLEGRTQLAVRIDGVVSFSLENFERLDDNNKAALIIHELVYTLTALKEKSVQKAAYNARYIVGLLFSKKMLALSMNSFLQQLEKHGVYLTSPDVEYKGVKGILIHKDFRSMRIATLQRYSKVPASNESLEVISRVAPVEAVEYEEVPRGQAPEVIGTHPACQFLGGMYPLSSSGNRYPEEHYLLLAKKVKQQYKYYTGKSNSLVYLKSDCRGFLNSVNDDDSDYLFYHPNFLFLDYK